MQCSVNERIEKMSYLGILFFLVGVFRDAAALECYSCNNIADIDGCQNLVTCDTGQLLVTKWPEIIVETVGGDRLSSSREQSCFTRSQTNGENKMFSMGCTDNDNCGSIPVYESMSISSGDQKCYECCGNDKCNKQLCDHKQPPPCEDTVDDCSYWNEKFDICNSTHKAKVICRKFCKLCSLVDGNWADWSPWSSCDVTCENGKHTRVRTCTNPAPAYQGLDCEGSDTSTKPCIGPLCPVHGGWTDWSDWGACPVTCGPGIQKRLRNCSNPLPLRYGDHCFGDAIDDRICIPGQCDTVDGGWTDWGLWTSCSLSCGGGMRKRSRSCSNPVPDQNGRYCDDDPLEVEICNNQACRETSSVAFNAYYVTVLWPAKYQVLIFSNILVNEGESYNSSTGIFVAPRNGTYQFNAQICSKNGYSIYFDIMVGTISYAGVYGYAYSSIDCASTQAVAALKENDNVFVRWYSGFINQSIYQRNQFSGTFIHE